MTENKRKISLGFLKPSKLEGDTIYFSLEKHGIDFYVRAYSNNEFIFPKRDSNNSMDYSAGKEAENTSMGFNEQDYMSYVDFLKEITEKNNCVVDEKRLIQEGCDLKGLLRMVEYQYNEFSSQMNNLLSK
jgi:hypothetical protein